MFDCLLFLCCGGGQVFFLLLICLLFLQLFLRFIRWFLKLVLIRLQLLWVLRLIILIKLLQLFLLLLLQLFLLQLLLIFILIQLLFDRWRRSRKSGICRLQKWLRLLRQRRFVRKWFVQQRQQSLGLRIFLIHIWLIRHWFRGILFWRIHKRRIGFRRGKLRILSIRQRRRGSRFCLHFLLLQLIFLRLLL